MKTAEFLDRLNQKRTIQFLSSNEITDDPSRIFGIECAELKNLLLQKLLNALTVSLRQFTTAFVKQERSLVNEITQMIEVRHSCRCLKYLNLSGSLTCATIQMTMWKSDLGPCPRLSDNVLLEISP